KQYRLVNLTSTTLCVPNGVPLDLVKGAAVCVMRGDCSFIQKAQVAQQLGVTVLLIASKEAMGTPSVNDSEYDKVTIPLALMRYRDFLDAQKVFTNGMEVQLYAPPTPEFDASVIIMLVIAVFTVAMGGFWSGAAEKAKQSVTALHAGEERTDSGDLTLYSPLKVMLFVVLMCVMLVLMYFFYKYLVYVIIVIFCLASATGLYSCLEALLNAVGCSKLSVSCGEKSCSVRNLLLAAVCITVAVVWGVYRNEDSLLLLYDVFFVFITPFLTPVTYTLGLVLTFVIMLLTKMGQPALLYLVPFTLLTSGLLAWKRKEFKQFWAGTTYQVLDSSREPLIPACLSHYELLFCSHITSAS
ncbi:hypothetical protein PDJAM_G00217940, partial [Pangasius djambal]|nr:hypothetical protein [Pangasius djambal]